MAAVHLGRLRGEAGVQRLVAIKRIHPHLGRDPAFSAMFLDEARIASRIHHPNVCQIFEYGEDAGTPFLVMELLVGEPLHRILDRLSEDGEASPAILATVVAEACDGLHAAHELRDDAGQPMHVVHRDVSPQNLFVTFDGAVKVVDFGIASATGKSHHTETGTVKGRFAYMAPEQIAARGVDRRSDVWSLGVVLWEVLARRRLFRRPSPSETIRAVESDPIPAPSTHRPEVPAALDAIVMRALSRDPDARPPTARALSDALREAIAADGARIDRAAIAAWLEGLFPDRTDAARLAEAAPAPSAEPTPSTALERATPREAPEPAASAPSPRARLVGVAVVGLGLGLAAWWATAAPATPTADPPPLRLAATDAGTDAPAVVVAEAATETVETAPVETAAPAPAPVEPLRGRRRAEEATTVAPTAPAPEPTTDETHDETTDETSDRGPGCATIGGGIRVVFPDGRSIEGPRRTPCVSLTPGRPTLRVEDATTGELLWEREVEVAPHASLAITASGVR